MLKCAVIGVGAAGNKAAIALLEAGVMSTKDVILLNSTLKDVPAQYKEIAIEFEGNSKGCAKERHLAQALAMTNLQSRNLGIDQLIQGDDYNFVLICTSAEGGTGSGASITLAKYIHQVLQKPVHLTVFAGFFNDSRGLKNTVDWFKETSKDYTVDCICNSYFLDDNNGNERKAEQAANAEFVQRINILLGKQLIDSETNIDDVDLEKLVITPGYQMIIHGDIGKPKNKDEYNKTVRRYIDEAKGFSTEASATRIGLVLNISDKIEDTVDYSSSVIKDIYGEPFEFFTHVQHIEAQGNYINIIVSGSKLPIEEIEEIYEEFQERKAKVDTSADEFFNKDFDTSADEFDMARGRISDSQIDKNRAAFFGEPTPKQGKGKFTEIKKSDEM
jgi:hypothetical protein